MSRLAASYGTDPARGARTAARRRTNQTRRPARWMVPTHPLMGPLTEGSRLGWGLVSLAGTSSHYRVAHCDRAAARLGASLLRAGVASAETWVEANRDPCDFLRLALKRWAAECGGIENLGALPATSRNCRGAPR